LFFFRILHVFNVPIHFKGYPGDLGLPGREGLPGLRGINGIAGPPGVGGIAGRRGLPGLSIKGEFGVSVNSYETAF
jgi:hypothetical protein